VSCCGNDFSAKAEPPVERRLRLGEGVFCSGNDFSAKAEPPVERRLRLGEEVFCCCGINKE